MKVAIKPRFPKIISFESIDFNLQRKSTNIFLIYECSFSLIYNFLDSGKKHTHTHTRYPGSILFYVLNM